MFSSKKIIFVPRDQQSEKFVIPPKPAKNYIPDWYKNMQPFHDNVSNVFPKPSTGKKCIPFLDTFLSGYIQETWCDIAVEKKQIDDNNFEIIYNWGGNVQPISTRSSEFSTPMLLPKNDKFYPIEFLWQTQWEPKLPPGYSCLYMHPMNRYDLPFYVMNGIIDSDEYPVAGPLPIFIEKDFEGIIPAGTPMYQMIFFERHSWKHVIGNQKTVDTEKILAETRKYFYDGYKKLFWKKKNFD